MRSFSKSERVRKARTFFDEFAKSNNFDPFWTLKSGILSPRKK